MIRGPVKFAYGLKLVATWMLIPFLLMLVTALAAEFKDRMTYQEVVLKTETRSYPEGFLCFKTDINGREDSVIVPDTYKEGDTVTVILRNGEYFKTAVSEQEIKDHTTIIGRTIRVCNNRFGYLVTGIACVLLISFLITFKKRKDVRKEFPKISKITDIAGVVCSVAMSAALVYAVLDYSLDGLAVAVISFFLGIVYASVFVLAWLIESLIHTYAK